MDIQKQSDLFYDALKEEYKAYIDDALKTVGFLLLALGWLLTSENAAKVLAERITPLIGATILLLLTLNIIGVFGGHFARSKKIHGAMIELGIHPPTLIANYAISASHLLLISFAILPLICLLGRLMLAGPPTN